MTLKQSAQVAGNACRAATPERRYVGRLGGSMRVLRGIAWPTADHGTASKRNSARVQVGMRTGVPQKWRARSVNSGLCLTSITREALLSSPSTTDNN